MAYVASNLKAMNRKLVFAALRAHDEISRTEISRETGISAPTVMKIVQYLETRGYVQTAGAAHTEVGRKPQMLRFNRRAGFVMGVEYTGDELRLGLVDFGENLVRLLRVPASANLVHAVGRELPDRIDRLIAESGWPADRLLGIGIGLPGRVDPKDRTIDMAPLEGITRRTGLKEIVDGLSRRFGVPVVVENDANAAAVGEFRFRGLTEDDDLLYIMLGKGVGSGIIFDGRVRRGPRSLAGEIGYMVFDRDFISDRQKPGWLEQSLTGRPADWGAAADSLALAAANLCVPLEIRHVVLRLADPAWPRQELLDRVRRCLERVAVWPLDCRLSECPEPVLTGCAHMVMEPAVRRILEA